VQIRPAGEGRIRLRFEEIAARLDTKTHPTFNEYMLRFATGKHEVTLFTDGRAIIKGTHDPAIARGVYARFIGS
jgi:adenylyltransferase/sulfurtransferase